MRKWVVGDELYSSIFVRQCGQEGMRAGLSFVESCRTPVSRPGKSGSDRMVP